MQHSIDLTSKLSFGAQPKGKVSKKEQNPAADADAMAGMTAQFSSALHQALQAKQEPKPVEKATHIPGHEPTEPDTPQPDETTSAETTETGTEVTTAPQPMSDPSSDFAATLQTALSLPIILATSLPPTALPSPETVPSSGSEPTTGIQATQALPSPTGAMALTVPATRFERVPTTSFAANLPIGEGSSIPNPTASPSPNTDVSVAATETGAEVLASQSSDIHPSSASDSGLSIDSTLTSLTESLPLPQIALPAKGPMDTAHTPDMGPLPVSGAVKSAENAVSNPLQSLGGISEQLKSLNGEIESVSGNESSDFSDDFSELDTVSAEVPAELAQPFSAEGLTVPQSSSQSGIGPAENPIAQFVSKAEHPADQVAEGTLYSVKNGHKELVIRLNPDNLGEVRINLISHGNQEMSARLIASTPESHDLLKSQVESLKQTLESQGLQVERLSVVLAGSPDSMRDFNQQNNHQHSSEQQQGNAQQNTQQQAFNQQGQPNPNLFSHLGGQFQHKQGFAQRPAEFQTSGGTHSQIDGIQRAEPHAPQNDNGSISVLA